MFILIKYMLGNVYSDAYIVVKVNNNPNKINKNLTLKKNPLFRSCISKSQEEKNFLIDYYVNNQFHLINKSLVFNLIAIQTKNLSFFVLYIFRLFT